MIFDNLSKEQQVMVTMRKVLTSVIREITPQASAPHPLSEQTITDIRMCFKLIAAREQELAEEHNTPTLKPHYVDESPTKTAPLRQVPRKKTH